MRRMLSMLMAVLFVVSIPLTALAVEVDVSLGDVTINDTNVQHTTSEGLKDEAHGGSVTVTGTTTENNITVDVSAGNTVEVTLQDVNIDASKNKEAAMDISGAGDVVVELDGTNTLKGGKTHAGLETSQEGGSLVIQDGDADGIGELTAEGGKNDLSIGGGAGIGGGNGGAGSKIEINSGKVTATGKNGGAGIGGGTNGSGSDIVISGGEVKATGDGDGAGIGGGSARVIFDDEGNETVIGGSGSDIVISGGEVTATSTGSGAGIGGGANGVGSDIEISGGEVKATGGVAAAGIGGGWMGFGENISISGDAQVNAAGNENAADVGSGGQFDDVKQENNVDTSKLTAEGSVNGVAGTYVPPAPPAPEATVVALPCVAADENGDELEWTKVVEDTSVIVTVEDGEVSEGNSTSFTFYRWFLNSLKKQGAEKLVVKTASGEIELIIDELLDMSGNKYVLTFKGGEVVLTVDGEVVEI